MGKAMVSLHKFKKTMETGSKKERDELIKIEGETSLLIEIEDIRDELNIISTILKEQESVINSFLPLCHRKYIDPNAHKRWEGMVRQSVKRQMKDVSKMEEQAKSAYNTVISGLHHLCCSLIILAHLCGGPQVKASQRIRSPFGQRAS
jgi:hypothetical protein